MKVVIFDEGFIPGLGRGPFKSPIEISEDKYFLYKQMGLKVLNAEKTVPIVETGIRNRVKSVNELDEIQKETELKEEIKDSHEETVELGVVSEETFEEPVVEETPVEVETEVEESSEAEETENYEEVDINSLTKKELIDLLTEAGVECNNNMTKRTLVSLAEKSL